VPTPRPGSAKRTARHRVNVATRHGSAAELNAITRIPGDAASSPQPRAQLLLRGAEDAHRSRIDVRGADEVHDDRAAPRHRPIQTSLKPSHGRHRDQRRRSWRLAWRLFARGPTRERADCSLVNAASQTASVESRLVTPFV